LEAHYAQFTTYNRLSAPGSLPAHRTRHNQH
jgi:hypothetical protein